MRALTDRGAALAGLPRALPRLAEIVAEPIPAMFEAYMSHGSEAVKRRFINDYAKLNDRLEFELGMVRPICRSARCAHVDSPDFSRTAVNRRVLALSAFLLCAAAACGTGALDGLPWASRHCDLVTDAAAAAADVPAPGRPTSTNSQGARCTRGEDERRLQVTIYARQEMVTELQLSVDERTGYLAEASVSDQPGIVAAKSKVPLDRCTVGVMLADDQSLEVDLRDDSGNKADICDRALTVATYAARRLAG
ncbi:DUF3558 family protein [Actinokineospora soli]|uniref:DUF3558 family protein n=1 Tax=Actinokineospora soli TaxID=1048753 RepID=A0ABW2TSX8_9PSEU